MQKFKISLKNSALLLKQVYTIKKDILRLFWATSAGAEFA